jgi:hypothetical protein
MQRKRSHEEVAKAARDLPGIESAMKRGVAKALDERRKLGLPIVGETKPSRGKSPGGDGK